MNYRCFCKVNHVFAKGWFVRVQTAIHKEELFIDPPVRILHHQPIRVLWKIMEPTGEKNDTLRTDWLPSGITGVLMFASATAIFFLPVFFSEQLGFSGAQIGVLMALQAVAGILASFPAGWGNDKVTSRKLVVASLLALSVGFVAMGFASRFALFVPIFLFYQVSNQLCRMSLEMQVLKTDQGTRTGGRVGLLQAWRFGGIAVGTVLAGYLLESIDFRLTFFIAAGILLVLILPSLKLPATVLSKVRLSDYKADFSNPKALRFSGWMLLFATHWGAEHTSYGLFLRKNLDLPLIGMGWYMCGEFTVVIFTVLIVGHRMNHLKSLRRLTCWGLALSGIGQVGMVVEIIGVSFAFRVLHGIGDGVIFLVLFVGITKLFDARRLGGNAGLVNLAAMFGMVFGSLVAGPVGERFGYGLPLWISGVLTLILILPMVRGPLRKLMA